MGREGGKVSIYSVHFIPLCQCSAKPRAPPCQDISLGERFVKIQSRRCDDEHCHQGKQATVDNPWRWFMARVQFFVLYVLYVPCNMRAARKRAGFARGVHLRVVVRGVGNLDVAAAALRNETHFRDHLLLAIHDRQCPQARLPEWLC